MAHRCKEHDVWTDAERILFYQAVEKWGNETDVKTRFTLISGYVKTKRPKQCAMFAR